MSAEVLPLTVHHTVGQALQYLESYGLGSLPVTDGLQLTGIVSEGELLDYDADAPLSSLEMLTPLVFVRSNDLFLSAARICHAYTLDMIPVIDGHDRYEGVVTQHSLFQELVRLCGISEPHSMLVLQISPQDYSLSSINRIVESNDAQILQLNTVRSADGVSLHVFLTLNRDDVSSIVSSFQRHDYEVVFFQGEELFKNELRSNLEHLMNYLNI